MNKVNGLGRTLGRGLWFLTLGDVIQLAGTHVLTIAVSSYAFDLTGSAWGFAIQQLVTFLPWVLFSGLAGPVVDRMDKRKVMISAGMLRGAVCLAYPYCASLEGVLVLNFLNSVGGVVLVTARTALIPRLCDRRVLLQANGVRAAVFGAIDVTVPAIAGAAIGGIGSTASFRIASTGYLVGALWFAFVPPVTRAGGTDQATAKPRTFRDFVEDMKGAYAYIRGNRRLTAAMLLNCIYIGGQNGANAIYYPFVETVLNAGTEFFGLAVSLYHGANLAAGFLLARFGDALRRQPVTRFIVPTTMVWILYYLNSSIPLVLTVGVIEGVTMSILSNLFMTSVQEEAPPEMTGRVWGLVTSVTSASEVTGILFAGAIAGRFGPPVAYCALGVTVPLLAVISSARNKSRAEAVSETA